MSISHFPYIKTLDEFDYHFQPSINKSEIKDLSTLRFLDWKENILFYGTPSTGKTHLATALGIEAAKKRNISYFITCHDLIHTLKKAHDENRLETRLKHFSKYKLLIVDEIGYLPVDKTGVILFFQLITKRYEHSSTIITTNQPFSKWGKYSQIQRLQMRYLTDYCTILKKLHFHFGILWHFDVDIYKYCFSPNK